jgi:hypothetical protein
MRKPRLLFRFSGSFLLRIAELQFLALFLQLPPRFTRFEPNGRPPKYVLAREFGSANSWSRQPS